MRSLTQVSLKSSEWLFSAVGFFFFTIMTHLSRQRHKSQINCDVKKTMWFINWFHIWNWQLFCSDMGPTWAKKSRPGLDLPDVNTAFDHKLVLSQSKVSHHLLATEKFSLTHSENRWVSHPWGYACNLWWNIKFISVCNCLMQLKFYPNIWSTVSCISKSGESLWLVPVVNAEQSVGQRWRCLPVSGCRQEVDAAVDSAVRYPPLPVDVQLLPQVFLILLVDVVHYGLPAGEWVPEKGQHGIIVFLFIVDKLQ